MQTAVIILYLLSGGAISLLQSSSSAVEAFSLFPRRSCSTSLLLSKKKKATSEVADKGFAKGKSPPTTSWQSMNAYRVLRSFPRFSVIGGIILSIYLSSITYLFNNSLYGDSLRSETMVSSTFLNSLTAASSLLNVASHSGVVLGALNDTYVISILIGVGFDVMTRLLQLVWWMDLTWSSFVRGAITLEIIEGRKLCNTVGFLVVLTAIYIYHMIIHVRALRLNSSLERLNKVLTGALNNLRGIPGDKFQDHVFAYTDLGGHLLPLGLSVVLLRRQHELYAAFQALAFLIVLSYVTLSRIPFNKHDTNPCIGEGVEGKITCSCSACERRMKRMSKDSSFTFNMCDGVCQLWLYSFEDLSTNLRLSLGKKKSK